MSASDEEIEDEESKGGKKTGKVPGGLLDEEYDSEEDEDFDE